VLSRWKDHFEEHLNKGSELKQPTHPVDLRDDGVDIDLPSCEEIEEALKYLKKNKHLQSSHLSRQTKFTIHKTLMRPVLLYNSETWVLTKREENQLLVFERKVLRTIS
jgi:hypothetical protein